MDVREEGEKEEGRRTTRRQGASNIVEHGRSHRPWPYIGRVRDQLAQKDFLVAVKRVDDQRHQLTDVGVESMHFSGGGHGSQTGSVRGRDKEPNDGKQRNEPRKKRTHITP